MNDQVYSLMVDRRGFFRRLAFRRGPHKPKPVTIKNILKAAERGRLESFLSEHYVIYDDPTWQGHLSLCRQLVDAGYLKAEFDLGFQGEPQFISKTEITISGRDYLSRLREHDPKRRVLLWTAVFFAGVVSHPLIKWLENLISL